MRCTDDTFLHIMWKAKHISKMVENNICIYQFEYTDFILYLTLSLPIPCIGKYVLGTFWPGAPRRQTATRYMWQRTWSSPIWTWWRKYISPDFHHNSSKSVNPALPPTTWNVCCDLLKHVCGTKMLHRKINWHISAIQNHLLVLVDACAKHFFIVNVPKLTLL